MGIQDRQARHAVANSTLSPEQAQEAHRLLARLDALYWMRVALDEEHRDVVDRLRALVD